MKIQIKPGIEIVEVGHVAVDSGQVVIVDPVRELEYENLIVDVMNFTKDGQPRRTRQIVASRDDDTNTWGEGAPIAVVAKTGLGDGVYPVFAEVADCGDLGKRISKLTIDFELGPSARAFTEMLQQRDAGNERKS